MRLPRYADVKPSARVWLGDVPAHWAVRRLKFQVMKVGSGVTPSGGAEAYELEGIPLLRSQNVHFDGLRLDDVVFISSETHDSMANSKVQPNDVLLNITGASIGRCCVVPSTIGEANVNQHVAVIRADSSIDPSFLSYLLRADPGQRQIELSQTGSGREGLTFDAIRNFVVPLPEITEQRQIAAFLDWKIRRIDALSARKQELLEGLKEKRIAVITQAVTRGLNRAAPLRDSGSPWLGQVPAHWEVIPLGFLMTMSGGLTPSMANAEYWDGDIPWVTPKDMKRHRISDAIDRVTEKALEETSISLIPVNAVLIVVRGMILAHSFPTAVNDAPVTINQDMKALRVGEKLEVEYLFWILTGFAKAFSALAQESAHGTRKLETEAVKKFGMPVPPRDEQTAIVGYLEAELQQLDSLSRATESTIDRLTEYRTALITAVTTGKIDVRNVKIPDSVA